MGIYFKKLLGKIYKNKILRFILAVAIIFCIGIAIVMAVSFFFEVISEALSNIPPPQPVELIRINDVNSSGIYSSGTNINLSNIFGMTIFGIPMWIHFIIMGILWIFILRPTRHWGRY